MTEFDDENKNGDDILSKQEKRLISMIREIKYGEVRLIVTEGKPVRVEEIVKSVKL